MVICLERGTDLHMAQLMPLPLTISCCSKIQMVLPFWYRLTQVVPEKRPLNVCVCVCQGPCRAKLHKWGLAQSPFCDFGQQWAMNHIVDTCPLTKFEGGLNLLHEADDHMAGISSDCSTCEINSVLYCAQHLCTMLCIQAYPGCPGRDWLGRTSLERPILCHVGRKIFISLCLIVVVYSIYS